jgi:hypothetical protein
MNDTGVRNAAMRCDAMRCEKKQPKTAVVAAENEVEERRARVRAKEKNENGSKQQ